MDDFKDAKSLYEEQREKGKVSRWEPPLPGAPEPVPSRRGVKRPVDIPLQVCEYYASGGCGPSKEAVKLGLAKTIFPCGGMIPPYCAIRQKLISGKTIQEVCAK